MVKKMFMLVLLAAIAVFSVSMHTAFAYDRPERKPAIVLAAFGTTEPGAVHSILNVVDRVTAAFPGYDVHLAFTSNIIRGIWRERAGNAEFKAENPGIPEYIYSIKNALSTLAEIQEDGARLILVQSLHVTDGEEYEDLATLVKTLENYKTFKRVLHPFPWIGVGEPALGIGDGQEKYLERAAEALMPLARKACDSNAALVLMGHGNEHRPQEVYDRFQTVLRKKYGPQVYIGTVEMEPFAEDIAAEIKKSEDAPKSILLAPMMVVAGDHARNDMAGDEGDSWLSVFREEGFAVETHLVGLGSSDSWADIYVEHLKILESAVVAKKEKDEAAEAGH